MERLYQAEAVGCHALCLLGGVGLVTERHLGRESNQSDFLNVTSLMEPYLDLET